MPLERNIRKELLEYCYFMYFEYKTLRVVTFLAVNWISKCLKIAILEDLDLKYRKSTICQGLFQCFPDPLIVV